MPIHPNNSFTVETLAEHTDFELSAYCWPCNRRVTLDKATLAERFGLDAKVAEIKKRLRCSVCSRRTETVYIAFVGPMGHDR